MKTDNKIPAAIEIEGNVLGAILIDNKAIDIANQFLIPETFFRKENKIIFKVMRKLYNLGKGIEFLAVYEELKRIGLQNEININYLVSLSQRAITSANIEEHCKILIEKWMLRALIQLGQNMLERATADNDPFEVIQQTTEKIYEIENHIENIEKDKNLREEISLLIHKVEDKYSEKIEPGLMSTSFPSLNTATGGLMSTDYIVIYGLDKSGKSTFGHRLLLDLAFQRKNVGIFSLEMDFDQVVYKNLAMEVGFEYLKLRNPRGQKLQSDEFMTFIRNIEKFQKTNIFIDDRTFDFDRIISKSKLWKRKHNIDIFCYDYIGLMESDIKSESIKYLIKYFSRRFKQLAKELNTPVILISQANDYEKTADAIDLLRDCDFAIRLCKPKEAGIKNLKFGNGRSFEFTEDHFLVTIERSRHGKNKQNFVCGYVNNKFGEIDIEGLTDPNTVRSKLRKCNGLINNCYEQEENII